MNLQEIKSEETSGDHHERLARALFGAAAAGLELPSFDDVVSCDKERVGKYKKGCLMYHCGANKEYGFATMDTHGNETLEINWSTRGGASLHYLVRINNPRVQTLKGIPKEDAKEMRFRIDGDYMLGVDFQVFCRSLS